MPIENHTTDHLFPFFFIRIQTHNKHTGQGNVLLSALFNAILCLFVYTVVERSLSAPKINRHTHWTWNKKLRWAVFSAGIAIGDFDYLFVLRDAYRCEGETKTEKSSSRSIVTATLKSLQSKVEWDCEVWLYGTRRGIMHTVYKYRSELLAMKLSR